TLRARDRRRLLPRRRTAPRKLPAPTGPAQSMDAARTARLACSNLLLPHRRHLNRRDPRLVGPCHALARNLCVDEVGLTLDRRLARASASRNCPGLSTTSPSTPKPLAMAAMFMSGLPR